MIKYRIFCDGADSGVWKWRDEEDFIAFLTLMHTSHTPETYRKSPNEFNTLYQEEINPRHGKTVPWKYVKEPDNVCI
jgi:hypothetical protein